MRKYTEVGKEAKYEREEIDRSISNTSWENFRTDDLPFCQGSCLNSVIKECNIPLSKIGRMDLHNVIKGTHGFYALDVTYKNGNAQIFIADNGCSACVVASDFVPFKQ